MVREKAGACARGLRAAGEGLATCEPLQRAAGLQLPRAIIAPGKQPVPHPRLFPALRAGKAPPVRVTPPRERAGAGSGRGTDTHFPERQQRNLPALRSLCGENTPGRRRGGQRGCAAWGGGNRGWGLQDTPTHQPLCQRKAIYSKAGQGTGQARGLPKARQQRSGACGRPVLTLPRASRGEKKTPRRFGTGEGMEKSPELPARAKLPPPARRGQRVLGILAGACRGQA